MTALAAIRHLWHVQVFGGRRWLHVLSHDKQVLHRIADSVERLVLGRVDAACVGLEHFVMAMWREARFPVGVSDELKRVAMVGAFVGWVRRERATTLLVEGSLCYQ